VFSQHIERKLNEIRQAETNPELAEAG